LAPRPPPRSLAPRRRERFLRPYHRGRACGCETRARGSEGVTLSPSGLQKPPPHLGRRSSSRGGGQPQAHLAARAHMWLGMEHTLRETFCCRQRVYTSAPGLLNAGGSLGIISRRRRRSLRGDGRNDCSENAYGDRLDW
jgi:hypothetical protein